MGNGITKIAILTHLKTIRKSPNFFQNDSLLAAIATRIFPTALVRSTAGNFKKIFAAPYQHIPQIWENSNKRI